jgi:hypothetical protein
MNEADQLLRRIRVLLGVFMLGLVVSGRFGLLACALVVPYAFLFGHLRGIPVWWRLIDCSFGVVGALPLWLAREQTRALEALSESRT